MKTRVNAENKMSLLMCHTQTTEERLHICRFEEPRPVSNVSPTKISVVVYVYSSKHCVSCIAVKCSNAHKIDKHKYLPSVDHIKVDIQ